MEITIRLKKAGELLGIRLLDHLIFSDEGYLSLLETSQF
ncbi:MAG: JAB domain-containing protein [Sphaerochaetaceae bacterium]